MFNTGIHCIKAYASPKVLCFSLKHTKVPQLKLRRDILESEGERNLICMMDRITFLISDILQHISGTVMTFQAKRQSFESFLSDYSNLSLPKLY